MKCKLCVSNTKLINSDLKYLGKYTADMVQCETCKMLQLNQIDWLEEAYSDSIAITDTGIMARNMMLSKRLVVLLSVLNAKTWIPTLILRTFKKILKSYLIKRITVYSQKILDFGGGYGILVRLLRDIGLNAYWNDLYTENLVARGFEKKEEKYNTILCFEVLEHIEKPKEELDRILGDVQPELFIASTLDFGDSIPSLDWWYYSFETGQHITFYNKNTFNKIAEIYGYHYFSVDSTFHVFTKNECNENLIRFYVERADFFYDDIAKMYKSLTFSDHEKMLERIRF